MTQNFAQRLKEEKENKYNSYSQSLWEKILMFILFAGIIL